MSQVPRLITERFIQCPITTASTHIESSCFCISCYSRFGFWSRPTKTKSGQLDGPSQISLFIVVVSDCHGWRSGYIFLDSLYYSPPSMSKPGVRLRAFYTVDYICLRSTVKPVFKTSWEIGTTWELRAATSVIEMDMGNKTTSEFRTVLDSPLGITNSQVSIVLRSVTRQGMV